MVPPWFTANRRKNHNADSAAITGHTGSAYYQFCAAAQGLPSPIPLREIFQPRISSLHGGHRVLLPIIAYRNMSIIIILIRYSLCQVSLYPFYAKSFTDSFNVCINCKKLSIPSSRPARMAILAQVRAS